MAKEIKTKKTDKKNEAKLSLMDMTVAELTEKTKELRAALEKKQLDKKVSRLKNLREIFATRKNLARTLTALNIKMKLNSVKSDN